MNRASRDTRALLRSPLPHLMPFSTRRALAKRPKAEPLRKVLARMQPRDPRT